MQYPYEMQRLQALTKKKGFLCVGLDTDPSYIPQKIMRLYNSPADAVAAFNLALIESTSPYAVCYKVQIAYYEAMGISGIECYSKTLKAVRAAGFPVIADIKRGDIADTASAYARAHFSGDFEADIITLNPYMGFDTLAPFMEWAKEKGKGAFVLLRTSNKGASDIECLTLDSGFLPPVSASDFTSRGEKVFNAVGQGLRDAMKSFAESYKDSGLCAPFGFVAGCTDDASARAIRAMYPEFLFLIPGYGAQGGTALTAAELLAEAGGVVNSSRGILCAWKKDPSLSVKADAGNLSLEEIAFSAGTAASRASAELLSAVKKRESKSFSENQKDAE